MQNNNVDDIFAEETTRSSEQQELLAMVEAMDNKKIVELHDGMSVTGKVLSIGSEFIFLDVGQRNEAVMKKEECMDDAGNINVKINDTVKGFVVSAHGDEIVVSRSMSAKNISSKDLVDAMKNQVAVSGKVTGINKGGFNVTVLGKKAFCPFSHIDTKHVEDPSAYLMKSYDFIITKVENKGNNVVVSRLPLLEQHLKAWIDGLDTLITSKKVLKGKITKITDFGLFVSLGEMEGLVHISEVSWTRSHSLKDDYQIGNEVECIVLGVERKEPLRNSKISLSMKSVGENPWELALSKFQVGMVVEGTITRLTNFGAFVQLMPGVEGLIHISEMSWGKRVRHPADVVAENQTVSVTIIAISRDKHSISCSLKDIAHNPWNEVPTKYPIGTVVTGTVAEETKYGFFVDLDPIITALLVHGKISKDKKGSIKKGDSISVMIEEIDIESRRISLSYGIEHREKMEIPVPVETPAPKTGSETPKTASEFGDMLKKAIAKKIRE